MPTSFDECDHKITVVIPNWNGKNWLGRCLDALGRQDIQDFRTIVVDNGSTDGSAAFIRENYPHVDVIALPSNAGFASAVNVGIERSSSRYIVLLNTDTEVFPDWLSALLEQIENSPDDVAAINSQMLRMDSPEFIDDAGDELSWYGAATKRGHNGPSLDYQEQTEIFSPCAAACLYRRDFLLTCGGFDARFSSYLEDVDLGLRGRLLGYRYLYLPKARVLHKGHGTSLARSRYVALMTRNRLLLFAKNMPARLLLRHAVKLLYGQFYFVVVYARPWSSLKGYLSFVAELPRVMSVRRKTMQQTVLSPNQINTLLHLRPPLPTLRGLVRRVLSKRVLR